MSVEVRPLNVLCNIQCRYCYQDPLRSAHKVEKEYDLEKIKRVLELENRAFSLFGGEPLLVPLPDLENLWSWGFARFGRNGIQTNGTLITPDHISLFKTYNVSVGISIDGPEALNDVRWHGDLARTRASTAKSVAAIHTLCETGPIPSLILTLHRVNASSDALPELIAWVRSLASLGVRYIKLHLLESESPDIRREFGLTTDENLQALLAFLDLANECPELSFDIFNDIKLLLVGDDRNAQCVWRSCDPYTTAAVSGVEGQGQRSNCGRTNKDGVDFTKGNSPGFERYLALHATPQEHDGCRDCRFFLMCRGQCPGTSIDGDWRNRTEHCEVWKRLFEIIESQLTAAGSQCLSLDPRREQIERDALALWAAGQNASTAKLLGL